MSRTKVLQLFNWKLDDITKVVDKVSEQGFTHIQISPVQGLKQPLTIWWLLYQPINFKIGNDLGDKKSLKTLCEKAKEYNLDIVADVVLHHVANCTGNDVSPKVDFEIIKCGFKNPLFYRESFVDIIDYNNWWNCTHGSLGGLPALNLLNKELRGLQYEFLKELKECGVNMFRFDALKHLSPMCNYFEDMIAYVGEDIIRNSYGECIENTPLPIIREYQKYMKVGVGETDDKNDSNLVVWNYSHDMELTFKDKIPNKWEYLRDYEHLLRDYKADVLFYARAFDDTWKSEEVKWLNNLYK